MTTLSIDLAALKTVSPFSALSDRALGALFALAQRRSYPRHAVVVRAGFGPKGLYVLLSGQVKLSMEDENGRQLTLSVLDPGAFFSDLDFNLAASDGASVEALQACELLYVGPHEFQTHIHSNVAVAQLVRENLAARLREAYSKISNFAFLDVRARVAQTLDGRRWRVAGRSRVGGDRADRRRIARDGVSRAQAYGRAGPHPQTRAAHAHHPRS